MRSILVCLNERSKHWEAYTVPLGELSVHSECLLTLMTFLQDDGVCFFHFRKRWQWQ
jgi:hypothetical protein